MTAAITLLNHYGWDRTAVRRALSLALASWLAFLVASLLHVHNAYWAAMPIWVIAQPTRGALMERGFFRLFGTIVGAGFGIALLHLPVSPYVQVTALALWIGIHAGLTHLHRGVHGYGATLSAITAGIVVIPSLHAPSNAVLLALSRVDCTLIGVIVGTLIMAWLTPESPLTDFYAQVRSVSVDAVDYAAKVVRGSSDKEAGEARILSLISRLESTARVIAAGSLEGYRRQRQVDLLIVASLSAMAAARDIRDGRFPLDPTLPLRLEALRENLSGDALPPPATGSQGAAPQRLARAIGDLLAAHRALSCPESAAAKPPRRRSWLAPHREAGLALRAGALVGGLCLSATLLAIWSGIPALGMVAMGVCVLSLVLSGMSLPQLMAPKMFTGVLLGASLAALYRLTLQPHLGTTTSTLLVLIPVLLVGGFIRNHPRTAALGIDLLMVFLMGSQYGMPVSHQVSAVLRDAGAIALGSGIGVAVFLLVPRNPRRQARDAVAMIRKDLLRILQLEAEADPQVWHARGSRQILRLSLHIGRAGGEHPTGMLATLNLGRAMIDLHQLGMPTPVGALVNGVLRQEVTPQQGVQGLRSLAEGDQDEQRKPRIQRLADTLEQAGGLLTFGLSRQRV